MIYLLTDIPSDVPLWQNFCDESFMKHFCWNQFSSICFKFQNFIPRIFSQVSREKVFRILFILTNQNYHYVDIFGTLQIPLTLLGICSENKYHEIFYNSVLMYLAQWHVFNKKQHTKNLMSCLRRNDDAQLQKCSCKNTLEP